MPVECVDGFDILIIPGDHRPAHVHVVHGGAQAVFLVHPDIVLRDNLGMKSSVRRRAAIAIAKVHGRLLKLWRQYNGEP